MSETVSIVENFKEELETICGQHGDSIEVYRREDGKVFFQYGKCKLHLQEDEFKNIVKKG